MSCLQHSKVVVRWIPLAESWGVPEIDFWKIIFVYYYAFFNSIQEVSSSLRSPYLLKVRLSWPFLEHPLQVVQHDPIFLSTTSQLLRCCCCLWCAGKLWCQLNNRENSDKFALNGNYRRGRPTVSIKCASASVEGGKFKRQEHVLCTFFNCCCCCCWCVYAELFAA